MPRILLLVLSGLLFSSGCKKPEDSASQSASSAPPRAAVQLAVVVVDDPSLVSGVELLRGEWAERSGGQLTVTPWSIDELLEADELPADVVIYPARYVGTLVDRDWLRPVRDTVLQNRTFAFNDILPLIRNRSQRYGDQVYALSLGDPPLMLAWQAAALAEVGATPPATWEEFDQLLPRLTQSASQAVGGSVLSGQFTRLKQTWARALLVRTIGYARHRGRTAVLFDPETMEPRITEPPFVRALKELTQMVGQGAPGGPAPRVVISWPAARVSKTGGQPRVGIQFTVLPRASEVYDPSRQRWTPNESAEPIAMLGFAGRSASVTRWSRNATSAFKLLGWIASGETASQLSRRSDATCWFRESQVSQARGWLAGGAAEAGDGAARLVTELLLGDRCFLLPRIAGIDDYLESLDNVVGKAVLEGVSAEQALREAADRWNALSERYGKPRQRAAYRKHLGLDALSPE